MKQHRILNAKATSIAKTAKVKPDYIFPIFAAFNTGLENKNGDDIYAVLFETPFSERRANTNQPYTLSEQGIIEQNSKDISIQLKLQSEPEPFINYLRNRIEDALKGKNPMKEFFICYNRGINISIKDALQEALQRDSPKSSLSLYESTHVSPVPNDKRTDFAHTYQVVHENGAFDKCVQMTDGAYDELKKQTGNK